MKKVIDRLSQFDTVNQFAVKTAVITCISGVIISIGLFTTDGHEMFLGLGLLYIIIAGITNFIAFISTLIRLLTSLNKLTESLFTLYTMSFNVTVPILFFNLIDL